VVQAVRLTGTVAELHARDPFADGAVEEPAVWWCDFTDAAIVLGSSQRDDVLDRAAVDAAGLSVVRRRSGGGAVLLVPGSVVWVDLVVPAGTWPDDVRGSMVAAGEAWRDALGAAGVADPATLAVHDGGMVTSAWSTTVCFAGVGPGEVLDASATPPRKLVGLSQRRGRHGARIQGQLHTAALVAGTAQLIAVGRRPPGAPAEAAVSAGADPGALAAALAARITTM